MYKTLNVGARFKVSQQKLVNSKNWQITRLLSIKNQNCNLIQQMVDGASSKDIRQNRLENLKKRLQPIRKEIGRIIQNSPNAKCYVIIKIIKSKIKIKLICLNFPHKIKCAKNCKWFFHTRTGIGWRIITNIHHGILKWTSDRNTKHFTKKIRIKKVKTGSFISKWFLFYRKWVNGCIKCKYQQVKMEPNKKFSPLYTENWER